MNRQNEFSLVALCSLSVAAVLMFAQPTSGQEQRGRSAPPPQARPAPPASAPASMLPDVSGIKILKVGSAQPRLPKLPQPPPGNPPPDLGPSDLAAALKALFGNTPPEKLIHTKLTVRHGYEAGQVSMVLWSPKGAGGASYLHNFAALGEDAGVNVELQAKAGQSYLLDLSYGDVVGGPCTFTITGPDATTQTILCANSGHVLTGFYATTSGAQQFSIQNSAKQWVFHSISISAQANAQQSGNNAKPFQVQPNNAAQTGASPDARAEVKIFKSGNYKSPHAHAPPSVGSTGDIDPAALAAATRTIFGVTTAQLKKVSLTSGHGIDGGLADLEGWAIRRVAYENDRIDTENAFTVNIAATANQSYMVDMTYEITSVSDLGKDCHLTVEAPGNATTQMTCPSKPGPQHLVVGLLATQTGRTWIDVALTVPWTFRRVTITHQ